MRNAFILLVIVAALLAAVGAVNHGAAVDVDYLFGSWTAVSLLWVVLVVGGVVVVAGLVAVVLAAVSGGRDRRKLEVELKQTYVRLRKAEAAVAEERAARPVPSTLVAVPAPVSPAGEEEATSVSAVPAEPATAVFPPAGEAVTSVSPAAPEAETAVVAASPPEDATAVAVPEAGVEHAGEAPEAETEGPPGEAPAAPDR